MFNPSRDQVRSFFIDTWRKARAKEVLTPMETIAADIIALHPEYHAVVEDPEAVHQINPFLHLSLHLAIEEQLSIDQPPGIRAAFEAACQHRGNRHDAMHDALECLGEMLFDAQRKGTPPDGATYVGALRKRAGLAI
jgi:hypothetical protein